MKKRNFIFKRFLLVYQAGILKHILGILTNIKKAKFISVSVVLACFYTKAGY